MNVMDTKETASMLRVSVSTIRKLVKNNEIPFFYVASRLYFEQEAIEQWISSQQVKNTQKVCYSQNEIKSYKTKKDTMCPLPTKTT